ncbi:MAG: T9SS type A sorting domain-containing protein [Bacteroidales bacterium]|nr:T9SS type A sorting domain-containing protein [Bacteroidales bacterium]
MLAELPNNTTSYRVDSDGGCYVVEAHCGNAVSRSEEYCVDAIADVAADSYKLYPNPASDRVEVVCEGMTGITLYSMLGEAVLSKAVDSDVCILSVDDLPAGVYMVAVDCTKGRLMGKLTINN